jgi:hypothetical protein
MLMLHLCYISKSNTQTALQGTCVCNLGLFFLQSQMQKESIYGNVALVPHHYVQYNESTAGHICVQSEIDFSAKSNA